MSQKPVVLISLFLHRHQDSAEKTVSQPPTHQYSNIHHIINVSNFSNHYPVKSMLLWVHFLAPLR